MPLRRRSARCSLVLACALAACAGQRPGPTDAVLAYTAALRDARYVDAYRLLSAESRRAISYEDFERLAREHPDEVRETLRWLEQVDPAAPVTARLELQGGETLTLVQESGQWRLDPSALDFYGQRTPLQALRSFLRALRNGRYDILLRFVPRNLAEGLTAQRLEQAWARGPDRDDVDAMARDLETALRQPRPIEVVGNTATMTYGTGGQRIAQLVREDGVWKIVDPD